MASSATGISSSSSEYSVRPSILSRETKEWRLQNTPFFRGGEFLPYYSRDQFEKPASLTHGLSLSEERTRRRKAVQFLRRIGNDRNLPLSVVGLAIDRFHRFYQSESMAIFAEWAVCGACLFSSAKVEESRTSLQKISESLRKECAECANLSESDLLVQLLDTDLAINQALNFGLIFAGMPHFYLFPLAVAMESHFLCDPLDSQSLSEDDGSMQMDVDSTMKSEPKLKRDKESGDLKRLCRKAWSFADSSLQSPILNLGFPPQMTAVACFELALRMEDDMSVWSVIPLNWSDILSNPNLNIHKLTPVMLQILEEWKFAEHRDEESDPSLFQRLTHARSTTVRITEEKLSQLKPEGSPPLRKYCECLTPAMLKG